MDPMMRQKILQAMMAMRQGTQGMPQGSAMAVPAQALDRILRGLNYQNLMKNLRPSMPAAPMPQGPGALPPIAQ
jgi:hypothetical protein